MIFPLIILPNFWVFFLNIILWPIFHLGISKITLLMKDKYFQQDHGLYAIRPYEQDGLFYTNVLNIRVWKKWIPDGATIFNEGFKKKQLLGTQSSYIQQFILETRRAELTHVLQIIPCLVFFIFNVWWVALIMVVYAFAFNLPLIWLQRYNRIRFTALLTRLR
jgi:glycosyl-4,4'-diaponeurosporenoate acyltransferase